MCVCASARIRDAPPLPTHRSYPGVSASRYPPQHTHTQIPSSHLLTVCEGRRATVVCGRSLPHQGSIHHPQVFWFTRNTYQGVGKVRDVLDGLPDEPIGQELRVERRREVGDLNEILLSSGDAGRFGCVGSVSVGRVLGVCVCAGAMRARVCPSYVCGGPCLAVPVHNCAGYHFRYCAPCGCLKRSVTETFRARA